MTWVEGKEGREETLLPSKHTEQLLYLPQGVCFPPPPIFLFFRHHTLWRGISTLQLSARTGTKGTKPGHLNKCFSAREESSSSELF